MGSTYIRQIVILSSHFPTQSQISSWLLKDGFVICKWNLDWTQIENQIQWPKEIEFSDIWRQENGLSCAKTFFYELFSLLHSQLNFWIAKRKSMAKLDPIL